MICLIRKSVFAAIIGSVSTTLIADSYVIPPDDVDLVGSLKTMSVEPGSFPVDIARNHRIGQIEFLSANPGLKRWLPVNPDQYTDVLMPTRYILPSVDRFGIVINLAEQRLYYFPEVENLLRPAAVLTYPVSIGRAGWQTPITGATVTRRRENPPWYPPASIKEEALQRGIVLPDVFPPGPDNPLGQHAIYLDIPGYLIHGTSNPIDIGVRVTHGCIRMYPKDITYLFSRVPTGTPVNIIHEPVKVGWYAGKLYMEVHSALSEMDLSDDALYHMAIKLVDAALDERPVTSVQSRKIRQLIESKHGIPVVLNMTSVDRY